MDINYTARKVILRDNFKEKVEKKLKKFDKIFNDESTAHITVTVEKNRQTVEITIYDNGMVYRAEAMCKEMNEALDEAVNNLGRQIRKNKTKLNKRLRSSALEDFITTQDVEKEKETEYEVIRSKSFPVKNMAIEEAILQMNMLGHAFFMFRNNETNEINVVYVRKDGKYGHLEPQQL